MHAAATRNRRLSAYLGWRMSMRALLRLLCREQLVLLRGGCQLLVICLHSSGLSVSAESYSQSKRHVACLGSLLRMQVLLLLLLLLPLLPLLLLLLSRQQLLLL